MDRQPTVDVIVTIQSGDTAAGVQPADVQPDDLKIYQGETPRVITAVQRLSGERAPMELFVYFDDSIDSAALDALRPDLERFIRALPETTKVAIGNSTLIEEFRADHKKANFLWQPSQQSETINTCSTLLHLMRGWPSQEQARRRAILIIKEGVNGGSAPVDPYTEAAWRNAQITGIAMYSIFVRSAGREAAVDQTEDAGQSSLLALSKATGGHLYQAGATRDSLGPLLEDLRLRLANQYRITFEPKNYVGAQPIRVQTETPGIRIVAPTGIYVRPAVLMTAANTGSAPEAFEKTQKKVFRYAAQFRPRL